MDTIHMISDKAANEAVLLASDMATVTMHDMDLIDSLLQSDNDLEPIIDLFMIGYKSGFISKVWHVI